MYIERRRLTRRDFLTGVVRVSAGLAAFPVAGSLVSCVYDVNTVDPVKNIKPGEWVSHEPYTIRITNDGDPRVKMVNIRSTWDIHSTKTNLTRAETLVGTVAVGSILEVVGQIKGVVGDSASGVFFVAKGSEFLRLQGDGQVELNSNFDKTIDPERAYFVYKSYAEVVGVRP